MLFYVTEGKQETTRRGQPQSKAQWYMVCKGIQETKSHILLSFLCDLWKCWKAAWGGEQLPCAPHVSCPPRELGRVGGGYRFVLWAALAAVQMLSFLLALLQDLQADRSTFFCVPKFSELSVTSGCPAWHKLEDLALRRCWTHLSFCPLFLPPLKQSPFKALKYRTSNC